MNHEKGATGIHVNILADSNMTGVYLVNEITGLQKLFLNNKVCCLIMLPNATIK
jgi:hypothetical protein